MARKSDNDAVAVADAEKLLRSGRLKHYEIEKRLGLSVSDAARVRREYLGSRTGAKLSHVGSFSIDLEPTLGRNVESAIGCAQIPVGIAGPVLIRGKQVKNENVFIPLCTHEGALVASVNRGCHAINLSGGARVQVVGNAMTRAPAFVAKDLESATKFVDFVRKNKQKLRAVFEKGAKYLKFSNARCWIVGRTVFVRFAANTSDAMGMNMMTLAVTRTSEWLERQIKNVRLSAISGNLCVDKKPSAMNLIEGRGKTVIAEASIPKTVLKKVLKTTPKKLLDVYFRKVNLGSALSASLGFNAHAANTIAAMFLATGQDAAQIVESSMAMTTIEPEVDGGGGVYVSVTIPSLEVGAVGGGTALPTQRELLHLLGCVPGKKPGQASERLAEIIATAVLAGELSLLAALAEGTLSASHEKLGRGAWKGKL